jgi:penicillin amidase
MRALGYVHAQERFFEMDLMRRSPSGELAELFGPAALDIDKQMRVHRLRARVHAQLPQSLGAQGQVLTAYREGVNAGLGELRVRPWAYVLLRQSPRAWSLDDSVLVGLAMYADLQDPRNQRELALARIRSVVPPALYALIAHDGSEWDAPLFGGSRGNATLPDAEKLDLRTLASGSGASAALTPPPASRAADSVVGSNNFAIDGTLTADGRAIVADDMHLALRSPNIWFRARLRYPDPKAPGGKVDVTGFTLPGIPGVIVGSNGHVAWGFTNSYIDTADFARVPANATPGTVTTHDETIRIAGAQAVTLPVRETAWGPIVDTNPDGSLLALRWAAQLPGAVKLDFIDMARAGNLDEAFAVADQAGIPAQNLMLADSSGRIGWRIIGARPDRGAGCPPNTFVSQAAPAVEATTTPCLPWSLVTDHAPALVDPSSHRLWTANSRIVDGEALAVLGDGGYDLGARAHQIRDGLFAKQRFTEKDLLAIQLDDRAILMERWWKLLRQIVEHSDDPTLRRLEAVTRHWEGRASVDSVSYRVVRGFRGMMLDAIEAGLLAPAKARLGDAYVEPRLAQLEGVAWPLLSERPANLLPPPHASWDALLADVARALEKDLADQGPSLSDRTWGERNTTAICHPVARALPAFAKSLLCMPAEQLPGDRDMPRVQGPAFGASERMVVSPGHEADGIVHMPGGQSGHPLSPFWGSGHEDWAQGRATPFLPGPARYTLTLRPQ